MKFKDVEAFTRATYRLRKAAAYTKCDKHNIAGSNYNGSAVDFAKGCEEYRCNSKGDEEDADLQSTKDGVRFVEVFHD